MRQKVISFGIIFNTVIQLFHSYLFSCFVSSWTFFQRFMIACCRTEICNNTIYIMFKLTFSQSLIFMIFFSHENREIR